MQRGLTITVLSENGNEVSFRLSENDFDKLNKKNLQLYIDKVLLTFKKENTTPTTVIFWENYVVAKFKELSVSFIQKQIDILKKEYADKA